MISSTQALEIEANMAKVEAMLRQEESGYTVQDYFSNLPACTPLGLPVDAEARYAIASWCVKIMDVCNYSRETASIAMSCLDRFMSTPDGYQILLDRKEFQLAALTAVYSAVKVHEQLALTPELVAKLSQGSHADADIESMELRMLNALKWRVHPPTAAEFVRAFLSMVPAETMDKQARSVIGDLAIYQVEASLVHYKFCTVKASDIALASLMNAIESVYQSNELRTEIQSKIVSFAVVDDNNMPCLRDRLYEVISSKDFPEPVHLPTLRKPSLTKNVKTTSSNSFAHSPRTVSFS